MRPPQGLFLEMWGGWRDAGDLLRDTQGVCFWELPFCKCKTEIMTLVPWRVGSSPTDPTGVAAACSSDVGLQVAFRSVPLGSPLASRGLQELELWGLSSRGGLSRIEICHFSGRCSHTSSDFLLSVSQFLAGS